MKYTSAFLILFIALSGATVFGQALICTISTDTTVYEKGEFPKITISIKNNTDSTIQLVKTLDASSELWRFPHAYFKIEKAGDTAYKTQTYRRCGNFDGIQPSDFVELKSGNSFNPYDQTSVYFDYKIRNAKNFEKKGIYKITFYYSTNEADFRKWLGDWNSMNYYFEKRTEPKMDKKSEYEKLLALFSKVPKTEVVSNILTIEIK